MGCYSFPVVNFHLLLHAGLSRRTRGPLRPVELQGFKVDTNIHAQAAHLVDGQGRPAKRMPIQFRFRSPFGVLRSSWKNSDEDGKVSLTIGRTVPARIQVVSKHPWGEEYVAATVDNPAFPLTVAVKQR